MKTAPSAFGQRANGVGWSNRQRNRRPSPRQDHAITGRPPPPGPARPSPGSTTSPPGSLPRTRNHPPSGQVPETARAAKMKSSRSVPAATPTSAAPCADQHHLAPPPDAPSHLRAATAAPPVARPSHTNALARYIPAVVNRCGGNPDKRNGESTRDSTNPATTDPDPPCGHNRRDPTAWRDRNGDNPKAGRSPARVAVCRDVVQERESQAQSAA